MKGRGNGRRWGRLSSGVFSSVIRSCRLAFGEMLPARFPVSGTLFLNFLVPAVMTLCAFGSSTVGVLFVPVSLAQAQETGAAVSATDLRVRQQELLAVLLDQPDNLDVAFEYASVSARIGDFEAAISTFERMLIFAPGLPRVQLELGVLYYRLGSTGMARQYFEAALAAPDVPPEVKARVDLYLAAIDHAEDPTDFSATLVAGVRVQSNANAGPGTRTISLNGTNFLLDETSAGRKDGNVYLASSVHWGYDLGTQGDSLEADLLAYGSRYREVSRLDAALAELTFGPSLNMARFGIEDARLGIYGILSGVRLDYANYSGALGVGTRFAIRPAIATELSSKLEYRRRWYNDTATNPTVSDRSGYIVQGSLMLTQQLTGALSARVSVLGDYEEAKAGWDQSWEFGGTVGATYRFDMPLKALKHRWSVSLDAGYLRRIYDDPDPVISSTDAQKDHEGFLRAALTMPFRSDFALSLNGELRRVYSTYDLSTYNNAAASLALVKTF